MTAINSKVLSKELISLISVEAPYFALRQIEVIAPNSIQAIAPIEKEVGNELTHMANSETGRHLAIAGSLACALVNPNKSRHYYLATKAIYRNLQFGKKLELGTYQQLRVKAICTDLDKRNAKATTYLMTPEGQPLAQIDVNYYIMPSRLFDKLNRRQFVEQPDFSEANPFNKNLNSYDIKFAYNNESAHADYGLIEDCYCAGHFAHYPALPVAEMIHHLYGGAIKLVEQKLGSSNIKFEPQIAHIGAEQLGFSGEHVSLDWAIKTQDGNRFIVTGTALANQQKTIGQLELEVFVR